MAGGGGTPVITNNGTFEAKGDGHLGGFNPTPGRFDNNGNGIFRKSGGASAGTSVDRSLVFNNSGSVEVLAGRLLLNAGGTATGGFSVAPNATLEFAAATQVGVGIGSGVQDLKLGS